MPNNFRCVPTRRFSLEVSCFGATTRDNSDNRQCTALDWQSGHGKNRGRQKDTFHLSVSGLGFRGFRAHWMRIVPTRANLSLGGSFSVSLSLSLSPFCSTYPSSFSLSMHTSIWADRTLNMAVFCASDGRDVSGRCSICTIDCLWTWSTGTSLRHGESSKVPKNRRRGGCGNARLQSMQSEISTRIHMRCLTGNAMLPERQLFTRMHMAA